MQYRHVPVMVKETVEYLNCSPGKTYVDGTLGGGGHAGAILEAIGPTGRLIGIDRDPDAIAYCRQSLRSFEPCVQILHDDFNRLPEILSRLHPPGVDGILLDLGLSLFQLEGSGRGFSFKRDEPLDMRMNPDEGETAAALLKKASKEELVRIIRRYGEEPSAVRIARSIVDCRRRKEIRSSLQLAEIVNKAVPAGRRRGRIHPATRTFQAFRIAVNRELETLGRFVDGAAELLTPGGRLCIISFHSLEDRIVKQGFKALARGCTCPHDLPQCVCGKAPVLSVLTKKPVRPAPSEVETNPMARSAKLRAAERC